MTEPPITVDTMRSKLYSLDYVRAALARTEPLSVHRFTTGEDVRFDVQPNWEQGLDAKQGNDAIDAYITIGPPGAGREFQLTKDSLLEATSQCGLGKSYVVRCPAELINPHLNYWFRKGLRSRPVHDFQILVAGEAAAALTRGTIEPFSNLRLLEEALTGIEFRYGDGEVLADYKFTHSLRQTHLRLVVPERRRVIRGTGTVDDTWSVGLQVNNSLTGAESTSVHGYLFRWACTNGAVDTRSSSGVFDDGCFVFAAQVVAAAIVRLENKIPFVGKQLSSP